MDLEIVRVDDPEAATIGRPADGVVGILIHLCGADVGQEVVQFDGEECPIAIPTLIRISGYISCADKLYFFLGVARRRWYASVKR